MLLNSSICENGDTVVTSGNRLSIETAAEFSRIVREALTASRHVMIEFEPTVEIDLTGVQILCSACKSAAQNGKIFSYRGELPHGLVELIAVSGAERHAACKHNNNSTCIWFGGT